jgi:hypothetical protein
MNCPNDGGTLQPKLMGMVCESCGYVISFDSFEEFTRGGNDAKR